jgi:DNA-binding beta-propeller fold protein YncE
VNSKVNLPSCFGSGNGQFFGPVGVAVDPVGNVYVTDTINNRIQVFSPIR